MSVSEVSSDLAGSTATIGWANVSGSVYGSISPYNDLDWFATYLVAGVQYTFTMRGHSLDSYLTLRSATGAQVAFANRSAAGGTETIVYTPTTTGLYYIDAESYWVSANNRGAYGISVSSNARDDWAGDATTLSNLAIGQAAAGTLEMAADADWHRVQLTAGKSYTIQATGALSKGLVKVFTKDGLEAGAGATGQITFTASATGLHYVEVSGQSFTDTGRYELLVREVPTVSIADRAVWEGDASRSTVHFTITLSAPSPVDVAVQVDSRDRTAYAGIDYEAVHRLVVIPAGQTSVQVPVTILGNDDWDTHRVFELALSGATQAQVAGGPAWGQINDDDAPPELNLPTDPLMGYQWYLYTVRATHAWQLATGKGVKVGVLDMGIDATHPDLADHTRTDLGRNAFNLAVGGAPQKAGDNHGTAVAGVIGAARDGTGAVGVAYDATLVSLYSPLAFGSQLLREITNAFGYAKSLDVLNNSWGFGNRLSTDPDWAFYDNAFDPAFAPAFAALKDLAASGRNGLGTVVVQSAGNNFDFGDDTNLHNFQNSRYIITVGATDYFGRASSFSTSGASVLVSAPGGSSANGPEDIFTTDRVGAAGYSATDYRYVNGTSFSAPIVSGIVAMMLEANPGLGYRDVQQILAYTARRTDIDVGIWETNGAGHWNGGGMHFNGLIHATGFGQADALAAVRLAASWDAPALTSANAREVSATRIVNTAIADAAPDRPLRSAVNINESIVVERADVTVSLKHSFIGDLSILLVSPSGTVSFLLWRPSQGALSAYGSAQDDVHFTFDSVLNWGEDSRGTWSLSVADNVAGDVGMLENWTLTLVGRPQSADDVYVYTNEYPDLVAADPTRAVLADTDGGRNTLNAAALGLDNRIDLQARSATLNGTPLSIAAGTTIRTAVGGSGNDTLVAAHAGSVLRGMDGTDSLRGGNGNDRLEGGAGGDLLQGNGGIDTAVFTVPRAQASIEGRVGSMSVSTPRDGVDDLRQVERLAFTDISLAFDLDGHAGQAARLVGALFGPARVQDEHFMGSWLARLDEGMSYQAAVTAAVRSPEFFALAGSASNAAFVNLVYRNVVGVTPDAASRDFYVGMLARGEFTQASLAMVACELDLTAARIGLAGLASEGLEYLGPEG